MRQFDAKAHNVLRHARIFDREIYESMRSIIDQSGLSEAISGIDTRIKLDLASQTNATLTNFRKVLSETLKAFLKPKKLFIEEEISINKLIWSISRLQSLLVVLSDRQMKRHSWDDDSFKPSNVNIDRVLNYIDLAMDSVREDLRDHPKAVDLLMYLEFSKEQLADDNPSWKAVVGALVIAATIVSGIAAAPEAYDNIKAALDHILGTSVERTLLPDAPPRLPRDTNENWDNEVVET